MVVTSIQAEKQKYFYPLLSEAVIKKLGEPGVIGIGAVTGQEEGGLAVGILVARISKSNVRILWIYVAQEWRRQGIGSSLLGGLLEGLQSMEWPGTVSAVTGPDTPAEVCSLLEKRFQRKPVAKKGIPWLFAEALQQGLLSRPVPAGVVMLSELHRKYLRQAEQELDYKGAAIVLPPRWETFAPCSTAYIRDGKVQAAVLFLEEDGTVSLAAVGVRHGCTEAHAAALIGAANEICRRYPKDTKIRLATISEASELVASMYPKDISWDIYERFLLDFK